MPPSRTQPLGRLQSHYLHELPSQEEERLEKLFNSLDLDGNGRIDIHDLSKALHEAGVHKSYAEKFIARSDQTKSGDIGLAEFVHYVREHEKNLRLQFSDLDKNQDGKIDLEELVRAFKDLGLEIDRDEATKLLKRMDKDGSLNISFDEWRDFLLHAPSTDIHEIIHYWRHSMYMDFGAETGVPDEFSEREIISKGWWRHFVAGAVAGGVSRTFTAPFDRIKVTLQVHGTSKHCSAYSCGKYMYLEGGLKSYWRGNLINVIKIAPEMAVKFMAYEQVKRLIKGTATQELNIYERFAAGSAAGGISQSIIYPLEVLKTRMAIRTTKDSARVSEVLKKIYNERGWISFYRGYVPNFIGILPYAGIDLAVYETLKNWYIRTHGNKEPSWWVVIFCATFSSASGQVVSYPLALVRTRLQANVSPCTSWISIFKHIWKVEGVKGLYRGWGANFIKVIPSVSLSYNVYEGIRGVLDVDMT